MSEYHHITDGLNVSSEFRTIGEVQPLAEDLYQRIRKIVGLGHGQTFFVMQHTPTEAQLDQMEWIQEGTNDNCVVIGGQFTLMHCLVERLARALDYRVYEAITDRQSVEVVADDGTVTKTSIFAHEGFRRLV